MHLRIHKSKLLEPLIQVSHAINHKNPISALAGVFMSLSKNGLRLVGSDVGHAIVRNIPADDMQIVRLGSIVLPSKKFIDIVKTMPSEEIAIDLKGLEAHISVGKIKLKLSGIDSGEYTFRPVKGEEAFKMKGEQLRELIRRTEFAANARDEMPILGGIRIQSEDSGISFTSCDKTKLASVPLEVESKQDFQVAVEAGHLRKTKDLFGVEEEVSVSFAGNRTIFSTEGTTAHFTNMEGIYPKVESLLDQGAVKASFWLTTSEIAEAARRIKIIGDGAAKNMFIKASPGEVVIFGKGETGRIEEFLEPGEYEGEDIRVCVNAEFFLEVLEATNGTEVKIEIGKFAELTSDEDKAKFIVIPRIAHEGEWT
ncbi:DNA polymerase III subunit beta [Paenibacillaceae bacterium WGS1546]|uniref:DNA polymerase III subunit beta n=1 Tax=Cohnella sp. WGS1546 TaxID=3366810 RepID=UPI00372D74FC